MGRRKSEEASADYFSTSSIDNEPKEPKPAKGLVLDNDDHEEAVDELMLCSMPEKFKFKLVLALQGADGGIAKHEIPVIAGEAPKERIEELLNKDINSKWFLEKLHAVAGKQLFRPQPN